MLGMVMHPVISAMPEAEAEELLVQGQPQQLKSTGDVDQWLNAPGFNSHKWKRKKEAHKTHVIAHTHMYVKE